MQFEVCLHDSDEGRGEPLGSLNLSSFDAEDEEILTAVSQFFGSTLEASNLYSYRDSQVWIETTSGITIILKEISHGN